MRNGGFRVGKILDGVKVKEGQVEDEKFLCKGPMVMIGYFKEEENQRST
jgi:long-subunit acyl-CoA synthetase (AMP-forming)